MKAGSDGETITDQMLNDNRITSDEEYAGEVFANLKRGDVLLIHKGAFAKALVSIDHKIPEDQLSEKSLGIDYAINVLSRFEDVKDTGLSFTELWGSSPPTGTFYPIYSGNTTYDRVNAWYNYINNSTMMNNTIKLLKIKKQIILQGPPGTGKTRQAKEIASLLTSREEITKEDIVRIIKIAQTIDTSTGYSSFTVLIIDMDKLSIKLSSTGKAYNVPHLDTIKAYKGKIWLNGAIANGTDTYAAAVAKYIYENFINENVKLIQFHPAYSYEDFVRGIIATTDNGPLEYKTINKVLGEFAELANENFKESKKDLSVLSKEKWAENMFAEFAEQIEDSLETTPEFRLNDTVSIREIDSDAFRYNGKSWENKNGHRMKFHDIITMYLSGFSERKEIRKLDGISKTASEHATYFLLVLNKFKEFVANKPAYNDLAVRPKLKNYVLIIDEINRANLPSVLGELIYALEYRGESIDTVYSIEGDRRLTLPPNLYIIGTMNSADRSVGHIDYAIRRRFAFVDVLPTDAAIDDVIKDGPLNKKAKELYKNIEKLFYEKANVNDQTPVYLAPDFKAKDVQLGHSYFLVKTAEELDLKLEYEIKPILREYLKDGLLLSNAEAVIEGLSV